MPKYSQLAVPIRAGTRALGVLYVESAQEQRFGYDDEDVMVSLAGGLGAAIQLLHHGPADHRDEVRPPPRPAPAPPSPAGPPLQVRHFAENDSIFIDTDYLIKGVAGSILWALLSDHVETGRTAFSNRELRLDPRIRLPDISDNLEARLILLARRLIERNAPIRIEKETMIVHTQMLARIRPTITACTIMSAIRNSSTGSSRVGAGAAAAALSRASVTGSGFLGS